MITEKDLQEAIAHCQGVLNPDANTCIKLASYLTIQDHMQAETRTEAPHTRPETFSFDNRSNYNEKSKSAVMAVYDDLVQSLQVLCPRLYKITQRKLEEAKKADG